MLSPLQVRDTKTERAFEVLACDHGHRVTLTACGLPKREFSNIFNVYLAQVFEAGRFRSIVQSRRSESGGKPMRIAIATDNSVEIDLDSLTRALNSKQQSFEFISIDQAFHFPVSHIRNPDTYQEFIQLNSNVEKLDYLFVATSIGYDNNYFFDAYQNQVIFSFADWSRLSDLPISNGFAYFITSFLIKYVLNVGIQHDTQTGCIGDFLWDKTGVNLLIRSAYVCRACLASKHSLAATTTHEFKNLQGLLERISSSSRMNQRFTAFVEQPALADAMVFLCHNSEDKVEVRKVKTRLRDNGIRTWFDEDQTEPGQVWQDVLESQIETVNTVIVFVGTSGLGPWQQIELRAFINAFVSRNVTVIPVIIGTPDTVPNLPLILSQFQYVDLRSGQNSSFDRLLVVLRKAR